MVEVVGFPGLPVKSEPLAGGEVFVSHWAGGKVTVALGVEATGSGGAADMGLILGAAHDDDATVTFKLLALRDFPGTSSGRIGAEILVRPRAGRHGDGDVGIYTPPAERGSPDQLVLHPAFGPCVSVAVDGHSEPLLIDLAKGGLRSQAFGCLVVDEWELCLRWPDDSISVVSQLPE